MSQRRVLAFAVCGLGCVTARAQSTTFVPRMFLDETYNSNVQYVGTVPQPDWATRLGLDLPVEHQWATGSVRFAYTPSYERHAENRALDHGDHLADLVVETNPGRTTHFIVSGGYAFTQAQAVSRVNPDNPDLFLTARTYRSLARLGAEMRQEPSNAWSWRLSVNANQDRYRGIDNFSTTATTATVESRNVYTGSFGSAWNVGRSSSVTASYAFEHADLAISGKSDTHAVAAGYQGTPGRGFTYSVELGGFYRRSDLVDVQGQRIPDGDGFLVRAQLNREFRAMTVTSRAAYLPGSTGAVRGTSRTAELSLGVSGHDRPSRWLWQVFASANRRFATDVAIGTTSSFVGEAGGEWRPLRTLGVHAALSWVRQDGGDAAVFQGSTYRGAIGLGWYPLGVGAAGRERRRR